MPEITATEAARGFSEMLNRVVAGEEFEITRNGAPIAIVEPASVPFLSAGRFRDLIATAPRPDADFVGDVRAIRATAEPPRELWPS
jgi:prevent-host-death family protein